MGRLIVALALAGAAAFAALPGSGSRAHSSVHSTVAAAPAEVWPASDEAILEAAEKDLAGRQAELGLVGAAALFGAEGLPKPQAIR